MNWKRDPNLLVRMVAALVVMAVLPFAFVLSLQWALNAAIPAATRATVGVTVSPNLAVDLRVVAGLFALVAGVQFAVGDRLALRSVGARVVDAGEYPDVAGQLTRLSSAVDLPTPRLAVVESDVPNAFAIGRSPSSSTIAVTTGLLRSLDADEREAVLAHELAHVKHRDAALMTLAYLLPTLTYYVVLAAFYLLSGLWKVVGAIARAGVHVSTSARSTKRGGGKLAGVALVVVVFVVTVVVTVAVSAFFWFGSVLVFRIVSRYREFAADRGSVAVTGNPLALASALRTLDGDVRSTPDADLRAVDGGIEALYVVPIERDAFTDGLDLFASRDIFPSTHPPTAARIERLEAMAGEMERS